MAITFVSFEAGQSVATTTSIPQIPTDSNDGDILVLSATNGDGTALGTCTDASGIGTVDKQNISSWHVDGRQCVVETCH